MSMAPSPATGEDFPGELALPHDPASPGSGEQPGHARVDPPTD